VFCALDDDSEANVEGRLPIVALLELPLGGTVVNTVRVVVLAVDVLVIRDCEADVLADTTAELLVGRGS